MCHPVDQQYLTKNKIFEAFTPEIFVIVESKLTRCE